MSDQRILAEFLTILLDKWRKAPRLTIYLHVLFWREFLLVYQSLSSSFCMKPRPFSISSCHDDMPMILHCIIGATWEKPCNNCPSIPMDPVRSKKSFFFLFGKRTSIDSWIQLIKPSQPTTLPWFNLFKLRFVSY